MFAYRSLLSCLTLMCCVLLQGSALPAQRMTGTKPQYLDAARRRDFALPLENGTVIEHGNLGQLFQKPLGDHSDSADKSLSDECSRIFTPTCATPASASHGLSSVE